MPTTGVDLVDPILKTKYTVMSLVFPLPFKVDNQAIRENRTLKFYTMYPFLTAINNPFISNKSSNTRNCFTNKAKTII